MKLLSTFVFTCLLLSIAPEFTQAQMPVFFRLYLQSKYPACYTADGMGGWVIDPNCPAITQEDSLDVDGVFSGQEYTNFPIDVVDLQYFTSLKYINLSNNKISTIEAFPPALEKLIMTKSYTGGPWQGPYFYSLPATLQYFNCDSSFIGTLPALPASLKYLNCAHNKLDILPALPASLDTLICAGQIEYEERYPTLRTLPALPAGLKYLDCSSDALQSLPSLPPVLKYLDCAGQWTGALQAPGEFRRTLDALPALPAALESLNCKNNKLLVLPAITPALTKLNCSGNKYRINGFLYQEAGAGVSSLPALPEGLRTLDCSSNSLTCIPRIPASLTSITLDRDRITCLPNNGNYVVLPAGPPIPLCAATNNPNRCTSDAAITGRVFYDANSNGLKEAAEKYCATIPMHLSNGAATYTNDSGYYILNTALGNYTLSATVPSYLNVVPAAITYALSTYDTMVNALIALQPNRAFDSVRVQLIPSVARPGFPHDVLVKFENVGTTVVSANLVLTFDSSRLRYVNAANPLVVQAGNQLQVQVNDLQPRLPSSYTAHFITSVSAYGDTLVTYATATANANTSRDSAITVVRGSYDPNDKSATPVLSPAQVNRGTFINYLVRFQNTGTDTAFNIVVTDTLDSQLDPASFELLGTSHSAKATIDGNKISFEFLHILLPDSNINEPMSHGYVQFRVKPLATLAAGVLIPNQAFIYFDYNAPVATNVADTKVHSLAFTTYTFEGNGNWNDPANWQGGIVPPAVITAAIKININPIAGGTCMVNVPVTISNQASLVVMPGARMVVMGNLRLNR